jgi:hypothetical protein
MEHAAVVRALVGADTRLFLQKSQRRNAAGAEQLPRGGQTYEAAADDQGILHVVSRNKKAAPQRVPGRFPEKTSDWRLTSCSF